ncbi:MAG: hypothetical protein GXP30_04545 [Verrucomicrobia bacterium]|nr:hypothetical protein [Verrucomicrobiota bacterium]
MRQIRGLTLFIIFGLLVSGITAFPLLYELNFLASFFVNESGSLHPSDYSGLAHWILKVREGLAETYISYPFLAYGTDWLAFGHIVIALFFIPALKDPVRYQGNYNVGIWASFLVIPLAFVCGAIREIPVYWRLIDCLFGIIALIPLFYIKHLIRKIEET